MIETMNINPFIQKAGVEMRGLVSFTITNARVRFLDRAAYHVREQNIPFPIVPVCSAECV